MRILVTGGAGFIGRYVSSQLLSDGHDVLVVGRKEREHSGRVIEGADYLQADFADQTNMRIACSGREVVVHLGWTTVPTSSSTNPSYDVQTNVCGSLNLLEACAQTKVEHVVFISTGAVYGEARYLPITEQHATNPISSYGITKLAVEKYLRFFHQTKRTPWTILRVSNVYGHGQPSGWNHGIVGVWLSRIRRGESIEVFGEDDSTRDFIHAQDVARATALAVGAPARQDVFNIGSGEGVSLGGLLTLVEEVSGRSAKVARVSRRDCDVERDVLDVSHARRQLNWAPSVGLRQGIEELWDAGG